MSHPPIVIFAYRRPAHLKRLTESLRNNPETRTRSAIIFCDAARNEQDLSSAEATQAMARETATSGLFAQCEVVVRPTNWGLARSLVEGVSEVIAAHQRAIILEDDLVVSPYFLSFMNQGIARFEGHPQVASLHGYAYAWRQANLPSAFFLRGADCWGFATWREGWSGFRSDANQMLIELRDQGLTRTFDLDGTYPYTRMLKQRAAGKNQSWAILWHASTFLAGKVTLFPRESLVSNVGFDGSGEHCGDQNLYATELTRHPIEVPSAIEIAPHAVAEQARIGYFRALRWRRWRAAINRRLRLP